MKNELKVPILREVLVSLGWKFDTWGNAKMTGTGGKEYRLKFGDRVIRFEKKAFIVDHNEWLRISSFGIKAVTADQLRYITTQSVNRPATGIERAQREVIKVDRSALRSEDDCKRDLQEMIRQDFDR
jgi:hypothetical protein